MGYPRGLGPLPRAHCQRTGMGSVHHGGAAARVDTRLMASRTREGTLFVRGRKGRAAAMGPTHSQYRAQQGLSREICGPPRAQAEGHATAPPLARASLLQVHTGHRGTWESPLLPGHVRHRCFQLCCLSQPPW